MLDVLNVSAEVVAAIFGIAVTVVAIIVQLAATRFNHQITAMFIRDPVNICVQAYLLLTTVACIWIAVTPAADNYGFIVLLLVTLALVILLPYFGYVLTFISPLTVIRRVARRAERAITKRQTQRALRAIDQLQDVARNAVEQGDRVIALACVNAYSELFEFYREHKLNDSGDWAAVEDLTNDPDFVSLEPGALQDLLSSGLWFESKLLQQFLNVLSMSVMAMRDVASSAGIAMRRIAVLNCGHAQVLSLALRALNSALRISLNARDARTSYHLLSQYRSVIEVLLEQDNSSAAVAAAHDLASYGRLAFSTRQPFILEVAAFDMATLIKHADEHLPEAVGELVNEFLGLDQEIRAEEEEPSLLGVRRAQLAIASYFFSVGKQGLVAAIVDDLRAERFERLQRLVDGLHREERELFWEFTPRGVNFSYLEPQLRPYLDDVLRMISRSEAH